MRRLLMIGAVMAAVLVPTASSAQFTLGARLGYGFGMGDVGGDLAMSDWVKSQVPVQIDALFRVSPNLGIGGYFSYGFGQTGGDIGDACDISGVDCSARVTRLGLQAIYSFATAGQLVPWAGAGIGYEWNTLEIEEAGESFDATWKGFEFLNLQAGADYKVNEQFSVGPYVLFALGQYDEADVSGTILNLSEDIPDKQMHEWLSFGVRGKFDL
jgi:opacity protein-like surface antigen